MEQHRTHRRRLRHRRSLPVLTAGIAALVLGVTAADSSGPAIEAQQRPRGFACGYVASAPSEDYCDRLGKDRLQREPTPDGSTMVDEDTVKRVRRAAVYGSWCPTPVDESCHTTPPEHAPTGTDVADSRNALAAAGFTDTIVRLSKTYDPAPEAALVYAVRFGDVCVVGFAMTVPRASSSAEVVGLLPNGRCLRP